MSTLLSKVRRALLRFAISGAVAVVAGMLATWFVLGRVSSNESRRLVRAQVRLTGEGIIEPALTDGLLKMDARSLAVLDEVVTERILSDRTVRVKLWAADGTILYSDRPELIGQRYQLGASELRCLQDGSIDVDRSLDGSKRFKGAGSELDAARYERGLGRLLAVYLRVRTPNGTPLLYEQYQRVASVSADRAKFGRAFALPAVGALMAMWLVQMPLASRLVRDVARARKEREALLRQAIQATALERERIAADLHDGVVQELVGLSYRLAASAESGTNRTKEELAAALSAGAASSRSAVRSLRSALLAINPNNVGAMGLPAAVADLVSPLAESGVQADVQVAEMPMDVDVQNVLYRGVQEALRNVARHADARHVRVSIEQVGDSVCAEVTDDGRGFSTGHRREQEEAGHLGLRLHRELVTRMGGSLSVESEPGGGTRFRLEVPTRTEALA